MNIFSNLLVGVLAGALIAGCSSAPYRSGKGDDHLVTYRPANVEQPKVVEKREVVYVHEPRVYYEPVPAYRVVTTQPTYRVITSRPEYSAVTTRPTYRYVPVTRYYYYD
jgi:hypothetical protein